MLAIAHRGASAYVPENTLGAFARALALGADGVELDVHLCATGEPVVIHDDTVARTTNGKGRVADLSLRELKALRTKGGEAIPTLEEALSALNGAYCFIEIKHSNAAASAAALMARCIANGYPGERLWLISFQHAALKSALSAEPSLNIGASFETLTQPAIDEAHAWRARAIIPHYQAFGPDEVRAAQRLGLKVICWTVNAPADIARLRAMGVDGIMSDYPDRLRIL